MIVKLLFSREITACWHSDNQFQIKLLFWNSFWNSRLRDELSPLISNRIQNLLQIQCWCSNMFPQKIQDFIFLTQNRLIHDKAFFQSPHLKVTLVRNYRDIEKWTVYRRQSLLTFQKVDCLCLLFRRECHQTSRFYGFCCCYIVGTSSLWP